MNYNEFSIEAEVLLYKLNEKGYEPTSVHNGVRKEILKKENKTDWMGRNDRLDEAVGHIMSVDDSTVTFKNKEKDIFKLYLVRGNSPGELVNDVYFSLHHSKKEAFEKFNDAVNEASDEFETWVRINSEFVFDEVGIAYALGMGMEEASEKYGG
tara:strand:- start:1300 stop:1761 length:462 start_codon:yes stop_codon:yes gene_type:complete